MKKNIFLILISCALIITMSFDKGAGDAIKIYPQPIKSSAKISCETPIQKIEVYTLLGTLLMNREGEGDLDFSAQPDGYYIIKVYTGKNVYVKRVEKH